MTHKSESRSNLAKTTRAYNAEQSSTTFASGAALHGGPYAEDGERINLAWQPCKSHAEKFG